MATINSLPPEIASMIGNLLDPSNKHIAKISCLKFYCTPISLSQVRQSFDEWDEYETKARLELFDPPMLDPSLLCALCRIKHGQEQFRWSQRYVDARVRHCLMKQGAIELGNSKLNFTVLCGLLGTAAYITSKSGHMLYPNLNFRTAMYLADRCLHPNPGSISTETHSPFDLNDNTHKYRMQQTVERANDQITLISRLDLSKYLTLQGAQSCQSIEMTDAIQYLQHAFNDNTVPGGLWVCPHISLTQENFCKRTALLLKDIFEQLRINDPKQVSKSQSIYICRHCESRVRMRATIRFAAELKFEIKMEKYLGPFRALYSCSPLQNPHLRPHLSARIS